jgi:GTP-binding protein HflX
VFNKIDAVPELAARGGTVERDEYGNISRVFLSARTGAGLDALRAAIAEIASAESLAGSVNPWPETPASQPSTTDDWYAALHEPRKVPEHGH